MKALSIYQHINITSTYSLCHCYRSLVRTCWLKSLISVLQFLTQRDVTVVDHPPYSPGLARTEFFAFFCLQMLWKTLVLMISMTFWRVWQRLCNEFFCLFFVVKINPRIINDACSYFSHMVIINIRAQKSEITMC